MRVEGLEIVGEVYIPGYPDKERYPALCICHGIPARPPDPSDRGYPLLAERFCAAGFVVMIFNFRGAGASQGNLDLPGWARDLEAVIDFLGNLKETATLSLMGFSGGAAVSIYVASRCPRVSAVVACSCPSKFDSPFNMEPKPLIDHFRRIGTIRDSDFPPSLEEWFEGFKLVSPEEWVGKIAPRPLLIVHGEEDEVVGVHHAWTLFHRAREPKEIAIIPGAGHRLRQDEMAMNTVMDWLKGKAFINANSSHPPFD